MRIIFLNQSLEKLLGANKVRHPSLKSKNSAGRIHVSYEGLLKFFAVIAAPSSIAHSELAQALPNGL